MRNFLYERGIGYILILVGLGLGATTLFYDVLIGRPSVVWGIMAKVGFVIAFGLFILGVDYLNYWNKK